MKNVVVLVTVVLLSNVALAQKAATRVIVGETSDVFVKESDAEQNEESAPTTGPATMATTGPATKPVKRIDKFTKLKFNRTPQSALQALAAKPDAKADETAKFVQMVVAGK